jgi:uncharacterized protein YodC (DUF2158 family)
MGDDNEPFKVGDAVRLKSGGTLMTVNSLGADYVDCEWFDEKHKQSQTTGFPHIR